jgi:ribosomal-protein-alanine N-acetyltransferase
MIELKGSNFVLRKWHPDDAASLQKHANNINVSRFLLDRFPSPYTLADAINFINHKIAEETITNFPIIINGETSGVIGVDMRQDIYRKTPLLGYWLREDYWGKGIITEAIGLITGYAFNSLDIMTIQANVLEMNPASMRALEKAGFVKQGILERSVIKHDQVFDEHIYACFKPGVN